MIDFLIAAVNHMILLKDFRVDFFVYSELIIPVINVPNKKQIKLWEEEEE
jgi:hypothetical protein